jgi:hypothetical protein
MNLAEISVEVGTLWIKTVMGFVITKEIKEEKVGVRAIIAEMQRETVTGETGEGAMGVAGETQITKKSSFADNSFLSFVSDGINNTKFDSIVSQNLHYKLTNDRPGIDCRYYRP